MHSDLMRGIMLTVRTYGMTIASAWYDQGAEVQREFEMHFKVARPGKIRTVERTMRRRGIPYFQQTIYRKFGKWVPGWKIRARFVLIEPATQAQRYIVITTRGMQYRGRHWKATPIPARTLSYAKKRKPKSAKRKRA